MSEDSVSWSMSVKYAASAIASTAMELPASSVMLSGTVSIISVKESLPAVLNSATPVLAALITPFPETLPAFASIPFTAGESEISK